MYIYTLIKQSGNNMLIITKDQKTLQNIAILF